MNNEQMLLGTLQDVVEKLTEAEYDDGTHPVVSEVIEIMMDTIALATIEGKKIG